MKRTIKQGTYGKNTFWYILNEPVLKTDRLVVFFPGTGELSMNGKTPVYDGSLINKVSIKYLEQVMSNRLKNLYLKWIFVRSTIFRKNLELHT